MLPKILIVSFHSYSGLKSEKKACNLGSHTWFALEAKNQRFLQFFRTEWPQTSLRSEDFFLDVDFRL